MIDQPKPDERALYVRPVLRHYGAITKLVQGMGGSIPDGMSGMGMLF